MLAQFTSELASRFDFEVIVSDGGSTDATLAIARAAGCTIVENTSGERQTIAIGRNQGAARARGRVLVFLCADTLIADPELFFRTIIAEVDAPGIVALTCRVTVYPEEERLSDRLYHGFYNWLFSMMNVVGMGMGRGECHIMRREVYEEVGGYSGTIVAGEDFELYSRLEHHGRVRFLSHLRVYESPRRYRHYGYLRVTGAWFSNFLCVYFLGRSLRREWKPIR